MLSVDRHPGGAGKTDGMRDDGGETDRMDVLSEVHDPGGTNETGGTNELTEIEDDGSGTDRTDAPPVARLIGWMRCRRS